MNHTIIDNELLRSFAQEAKSYLPEIIRSIFDFHNDPTRIDRLEVAHRHVHTIKGAARMVGLEPLSNIAAALEDSFESIAAGNILSDQETVLTLSKSVNAIESYLDAGIDNFREDCIELSEALEALLKLMNRKQGRAGAQSSSLLDISDDQSSVEIKEQIHLTVEGGGEIPGEFITTPRLYSSHTIDSGLPAELAEVFIPEAEEHLKAMSSTLTVIAGQPGHMLDRDLIQNIRRSAHSLKGSASVVGFQQMADLAHRMEDLLDLLYDGALLADHEHITLLFQSTDMLEDMLSENIDNGLLNAIYVEYSQLLGQDVAQPREHRQFVNVDNESDTLFSLPSHLSSALQSHSGFVRVPIEKLDEIVNLITELMITRSTFEQQLTDFSSKLDELRTGSTRLNSVSNKMDVQLEAGALLRAVRHRIHIDDDKSGNKFIRPIPRISNNIGSFLNRYNALESAGGGGFTNDFDDLEFDRYTELHLLLRSLTEVADDVKTLDSELSSVEDKFETCLNRQGRLVGDIQDKLMRLRMVPISSLMSKAARAVRTTASQRGKSVKFVIEGDNTQLDKTAIEELADPLLHILRNAVDHGIESPEVRRSKGKAQAGVIKMKAYYDSTQVVIEISDDGCGLDPEKLRTSAVTGNYLSSGDAAKLPIEDLFSLVFLPGFSTAAEISEISGRGVGLDVARVAVHRLKGTIKVDSSPDDGTSFIIRLPMTMAVMRALTVRVGSETFAIPLNEVKQVVKVSPNQIEKIGKDYMAKIGGAVCPLVRLSSLLHLRPSSSKDKFDEPRTALLMDIDDRIVAVIVDETLGGREVVVKNLGNHLRQIKGIIGATIMGNGKVVLILNLAEYAEEAFKRRQQAVSITPRPMSVSRRSLTVLVVDDSLSVRRVLSNLIAGAGWKSLQAKDGMEALGILPTLPAPPDAVLLDIEMPRMDGYELISAMRNQKEYENTPIIVITSRSGHKHREKAFELGATDYIVKPYQDEVLLGLVRQLTQK